MIHIDAFNYLFRGGFKDILYFLSGIKVTEISNGFMFGLSFTLIQCVKNIV